MEFTLNDIRNATYTEDGRIDCEINHPVYGWVGFLADPNDTEVHGRTIWAMAAQTLPPREA